MLTFHEVTPGTLPVGTETEFGTVDQVSLTAYRIAGRWVPFRAIHGATAAVEPLVLLAGGWS